MACRFARAAGMAAGVRHAKRMNFDGVTALNLDIGQSFLIDA